jgi:cytochrome P450
MLNILMTELLTLAGYALLLPAAVLIWLFYRFFIRIYLEAARYKKMDPTLKVFVSPMSGLLKVQRQCLEKHGDSHWFVKQMMRENPDQKAYLSNLGDKTFLIVTDTDLVREICLEFKNYHKFKVFKHVDLCYLRGIFFAEGADWKMQRALIGPAFNHEHLEHMIPIMMKTSKEAMQRLHAALPKSTGFVHF